MTMGISHVLENFRRSVSDMQATGDTALFDALSLAKDQLVEKGREYPEARFVHLAGAIFHIRDPC
jgi:Mg-chelatase subunit ChlD